MIWSCTRVCTKISIHWIAIILNHTFRTRDFRIRQKFLLISLLLGHQEKVIRSLLQVRTLWETFYISFHFWNDHCYDYACLGGIFCLVNYSTRFPWDTNWVWRPVEKLQRNCFSSGEAIMQSEMRHYHDVVCQPPNRLAIYKVGVVFVSLSMAIWNMSFGMFFHCMSGPLKSTWAWSPEITLDISFPSFCSYSAVRCPRITVADIGLLGFKLVSLILPLLCFCFLAEMSLSS